MSNKLTVKPFKAEDFLDLDIQALQSYAKKEITVPQLLSVEEEETYSIFDGEEVLACVGLIEMGPDRAQVWSALSTNIKNRFLKVHNTVKELLAATQHARLEAYVDCDFDNAHKWMRLLGFVCEAPCMKHFRGRDRDCAMYARYN